MTKPTTKSTKKGEPNMARREQVVANPFAQRAARMRSVLAESITEEDVRDMMQAVVQAAKEGNLAAARLALSYVVGNPEAPQNPDTVEDDGRQLASNRDFSAAFSGLRLGAHE